MSPPRLTQAEYSALLGAINTRELELEDDVERGGDGGRASRELAALGRAHVKASRLAPPVRKPPRG